MKYKKSPLVHGYANQFLAIDVGKGTVEVKPLEPDIREYFIGGRALGLYLLHQGITSRTKAVDPENPLILSPGPLGGIPQFPGTSKCMAISLSPLTGIPGVSNFGGHFGAYLKYAGFDALQMTGQSSKDIIIVIDSFQEDISLMEAPSIDQVFHLEQHLVERFMRNGYDKKNIVFVSTGMGAAHTTFGCINSHYYDATKPAGDVKGLYRTKQAGRTGLGSVMMDKKIRAVVILSEFPKGDNPYGAADWNQAKEAGVKLGKVIREVDPQSLRMSRKGSAGLISFMNKDDYQSLPVRNYQLGSDPRAGNICGKFYEEHLFEHRGMDGCFPGCNLQCTKGGWVTLTSGEHKSRTVWVDGPEYETAAGFGANLGVWHPEFIMEANWHCDNYGIDTITTAVMTAFLMECFQRGYLTKEDAEGLELAWGNEEAALAFIHQLATGETALAKAAGKGMVPLMDWIAARYAERTGNSGTLDELERFAMQTKGLPFSLYRTHRSLSMQGSYAAASDIGAHHAAAWLIKVDLLGAFPTFQDKARALISYPRVRLGNDNLGLCKLPWVDVFNPASEQTTHHDKFINPATQALYADFYNAMLGTDMTWQDIFERTDRDINLQRVMNALVYGRRTGHYDWIPDRAIGPTDDALYDAESPYNDRELARLSGKSPDEIRSLKTTAKRENLLDLRKQELRKLIRTYYQERGWTSTGIPTAATLRDLGLWPFLTDEAKKTISELAQ